MGKFNKNRQLENLQRELNTEMYSVAPSTRKMLDLVYQIRDLKEEAALSYIENLRKTKDKIGEDLQKKLALLPGLNAKKTNKSLLMKRRLLEQIEILNKNLNMTHSLIQAYEEAQEQIKQMAETIEAERWQEVPKKTRKLLI